MRRNLAPLNLSRAEVREAAAEDTGLPDAEVDRVVVNGLLNLAPDKNTVLREVARILKPGGRFVLAETTLRAPLPANSLKTIDDWFR